MEILHPKHNRSHSLRHQKKPQLGEEKQSPKVKILWVKEAQLSRSSLQMPSEKAKHVDGE